MYKFALGKLVISGVFLFASLYAQDSRSFPRSVVPESFGVNIHGFINAPKEIDLMQKAGIRLVRIDLTWDKIEETAGQYNFSNIDRIVLGVASSGMRPLLILSYSNPIYEKSLKLIGARKLTDEKYVAAPSSAVSRAAFARFAAAAVQHYRAIDPIWEIWNEPEWSEFWPPRSNASDYSMLAQAACRSIRKVQQNAVVIGPGAAIVPKSSAASPEFLESILRSGIDSCIDGLSIHPYLFLGQLDAAPEMWALTRSLISKTKTDSSRRLELVNSEWGLSTFRAQISEDTQASYLVRMMLLNLSENVKISIWYDWVDDGDDPNDAQHRFGILRRNLEPKPAYFAFSEMNKRLSGYSFVCKLKSPATVRLLMKNDNGNFIVVLWNKKLSTSWSASREESVNETIFLNVVEATDLYGAPLNVVDDRNNRLISRGIQPIFLKIGHQEGIDRLCI